MLSAVADRCGMPQPLCALDVHGACPHEAGHELCRSLLLRQASCCVYAYTVLPVRSACSTCFPAFMSL